MVSAAIEAAVSASISTPVRPLSLQLACTSIELAVSSMTKSMETLLSLTGWQSVIRSAVFLAAMIPARRATPRTSPFFASPSRISFSVSGAMRMVALAVASRDVISFSPTSTIWAAPLLSKWVSLLIILSLCPGEEGAHRRRNIRLPHQGFTDEEAAAAGFFHARKIRRRVKPAFAHRNAPLRQAARQLLRGRDIHIQRL